MQRHDDRREHAYVWRNMCGVVRLICIVVVAHLMCVSLGGAGAGSANYDSSVCSSLTACDYEPGSVGCKKTKGEYATHASRDGTTHTTNAVAVCAVITLMHHVFLSCASSSHASPPHRCHRLRWSHSLHRHRLPLLSLRYAPPHRCAHRLAIMHHIDSRYVHPRQ